MLHITNGDAYNAHLETESGVCATPFREAMMDGDVPDGAPFSEAFIRARARHHGVTEEAYREHMRGVLSLRSSHGRYTALSLYFGRDTFCQMNLLTLFAYLEELGYAGTVSLSLIDDETQAVIGAQIPVALGGYRTRYREILCKRRMPTSLGVIDPHAVALYFDFLSDEGLLARTVKAHPEEGETALIIRLLEISADYGLSDGMARDLIAKYRENKN